MLPALILGLLVVPGLVVAPVLFDVVDSRHLAGQLAGQIFHVSNSVLLLLILLLTGLWWWLQVRRSGWWMIGALVSLIVLNEFYVSSVLSDLRLEMGAVDLVSEDHPLRQRFSLWHGVSAFLHFVAMLVSAIIVGFGYSGEKSCK